ncbi:hypothetical protein ACHAXS_011792, partial [Conticribra weissflogii]
FRGGGGGGGADCNDGKGRSSTSFKPPKASDTDNRVIDSVAMELPIEPPSDCLCFDPISIEPTFPKPLETGVGAGGGEG